MFSVLVWAKNKMAFFLIGLDGANFKVIKPMIEKGKLPNFKKILDKGFSSVLKATHPPSTFPGWPTIATGLNPGKHGIYGFFNPEKRFPLVSKKISIVEADYINKRLNQAGNLWDLIGLKYKVCLINYPGTYPPKKINGVMVTGLLTSSIGRKKFTFPDKLAKEIETAVPDYEIDVKFQVDKTKALENVNRAAQKRFKLLNHFLKGRFDFYCVVFTGLDRIQHYLWGESEVEKHYGLLDQFLGILMEKRKEDNFMIVSDHGFQKNEYYFYINAWLIKNGFLQISSKNRLSRNYLMRKIGLNKKNILKLLKMSHLSTLLRLIPMKFKGVVPENKISIEEVGVDWGNSLAYATYSMENGIYLNLKGREPKGAVNEDDYEKTRDSIIKKLEEDFEIKCWRKEEIYSGPYLKHLPDIILDIREQGLRFNSAISDVVKEKVDYQKTEEPQGFHHPDGIFLACGPDIRAGKLSKMDQVDVLPTVLHFLGLEVPENADGKVVREVFATEAGQREVKFKKMLDQQVQQINQTISEIKL